MMPGTGVTVRKRRRGRPQRDQCGARELKTRPCQRYRDSHARRDRADELRSKRERPHETRAMLLERILECETVGYSWGLKQDQRVTEERM
ncbi:hypothetical protein NDU88_004150 [Pleurodeles waltl]|uniref:Uncharacterized protein n=1 Tax=Pleurodeles waltl TaxID=8319 RepID=A0AAV7UHB7_PLEWA|nr:hypothetical protein NDU88_004150 [Pleurodeles waltl]